MKLNNIVKSLSLLIFLSACNILSNGQKPQTLNVADFDKKYTATPNAQLIDVRTADEYRDSHLDKSVNIDYNSKNFEADIKKLDKAKPVFVYCLSGGRSAKAANLFTQNGFKEVYDMEGGILAWKAADKPVVKAPTTSNGYTMDSYLAKVKSDKLVLVDFSAVWCGPCKILKPIVEKVADAYKDKLTVLPVDVDANSDLSNEMHIKGIPLLVLYKQGKEVWRSLGLVEESDITQQVKKFSK